MHPDTELDARLARVTATLEANNIAAHVVDTADAARDLVLQLVPEGAEVHWGKSKTLTDLGLVATLLDQQRFNALRPVYTRMDRATQSREIRKFIAAPDYMLGSAQALTADGALVVASYTGFQIGPYAVGADKVILVVGSQKIVPTLDDAVRRVREVVAPYEAELIRAAGGSGSDVAKLLITFMEPRPGRTTVVLVKEPVGV